MPLSTQLFQQLPWDGGLNTRLDKALVPTEQIDIADNIIFAVRGSRRTRDAFHYLDGVAFSLTRASSGTTRTLVFDRSLTGIVAVASDVSVSSNSFNDDYDGQTFAVATLTTTTLADDTITYTHPASLTETTAADTSITLGVNGTDAIIGVKDFARNEGGGSKVRDLISVAADGTVYEYDGSGIRSAVTDAGTAPTAPSRAVFEQINEIMVIGMDAAANVPKKVFSSGGTVTLDDLGGTPPNFDTVEEHLQRLWANDKTDPDRVHYSSTGNPEEWNGAGDSAALDIGRGDGDPDGIVAIFSTPKGDLFVAKRTRLYRILGNTPETFQVRLVSKGIGASSPAAVAPVDLDEVFFASEKGYHSIASTDAFGDFSAAFLSSDVQPSFDDFTDLKNSQAVYVPTLNSVAWTANESLSSNSVYLYNIIQKAWYRWPEIDATAIATYSPGSKEQIVLGTSKGRILKTLPNQFADFGSEGIRYRVRTGIIYPDRQPYSVKGFKKLMLMLTPQVTSTFTVSLTIDNDSPQAVAFDQDATTELLGPTFILGTSTLGLGTNLVPLVQPIDGYGRGCIIEIENDSPNEPLELFGYGIEYEAASTGQDVGSEGE